MKQEAPTSSSTETFTSVPSPPGEENYGKGIIFYLRDNIVVGIVMWNVFNKMPIARKVDVGFTPQKPHSLLLRG